jgi:hypothetical protein
MNNQIPFILNDFWSKVSNMNFTKSSNPYPDIFEPIIQQAVHLKREGKYFESTKIYLDLMIQNKTLFTDILSFMYKVVSSAGYLSEGIKILQQGKSIFNTRNRSYDGPGTSIAMSLGLGSTFDSHYQRLINACRSEATLHEYLASISGNPNYIAPRSFIDMIRELRNV